MKRLFFILLTGVWAMSVFAQSYDEERGLSLYEDERYEEAVPFLQRAAKAGSGIAQAKLGRMYEKGLGVSKNYQIAMNMYKKAEESHEPEGLLGIGGLYDNGLGVAESPEKAFSYYKRAADMGNATGECLTGICYLYGAGTTKNVDEALKYLERSTTAKIGNEILGDLYYEGTEVPKDFKTAFKWYSTGYEDIYDAETRYRLAMMYSTGLFAPRNYDKALAMLDQLRKEEYPGASDAYAAVYKQQKDAKAAANKVVQPQYPGGNDAMFAFLRKSVRRPKIAIETAGYGDCSVDFVITPDGEVTGRKYKYRCNVRVDEEVMRLAGLLSGWKPATKGGRPVSAKMRLTIAIFPSYSAKMEFLGIIE